MFRRVSTLPRQIKFVSTRLFSDGRSFQASGAPTRSTGAIVKRVLDVVVVILIAGNAAFSYYINTIIHAREYVTDADMHEYRSQSRNVYEDKNDNEARAALLRAAGDVDKKVKEIAKERKPTLPAETVAAYEKEASDKFWAYFKSNLSFSTAVRNRNLDNFLQYYCTYREKVEQLKRHALEDAKVAADAEKEKKSPW